MKTGEAHKDKKHPDLYTIVYRPTIGRRIEDLLFLWGEILFFVVATVASILFLIGLARLVL